MAVRTVQPVKRHPLRRVFATLLTPPWMNNHFILAPLWLLSMMGVLLCIPLFIIGFCVFTLPNLSYLNGHSEAQTVTAINTDGSCYLGRGSGTRYLIEAAPLPDGQGAGGQFSSCDSKAPAAVGSTLTVMVRSDGSQRLRIDVNSIGDDLVDAGYLFGGCVAFGLLMSFLNVFRLSHRKAGKHETRATPSVAGRSAGSTSSDPHRS